MSAPDRVISHELVMAAFASLNRQLEQREVLVHNEDQER